MNSYPRLVKVIKLSGKKENFLPEKIASSIWLAAKKVGGKDKNLSDTLGEQVMVVIKTKYPNGEAIKTSEVGEMVEKVLIENGHAKTAKEFIRYRENKKHMLQDKATLGVVDDIGLSYNTLYILRQRYLERDENGQAVETPKEMIERTARFLAKVEKGKSNREKWYEEFYKIMVSFEFLPGTRTLTNAGKRTPQLANCFVFPINDDIDEIFNVLYKSTLIKKHGGGCGYNFSKIRPEGDIVAGIPNLAAGTVKVIEMFDFMTSLFKQEGKYESGNMAILNTNHPDIFNFISAKQKEGYLAKTNLSVGITDEFMNAVTKDKDWDLVNPKTGEVVNTVKAKSIFELMVQKAWSTGEPGMVNLSAINKGTKLANPLLKENGPIMATNVCGEIPCYPYESCNLGYLNFTKCIKEGEFDFERLRYVIKIAVRLMDNVIDASWFPVKEIDRAVREHRRLGIGCVGWAETLSMLGIAYDSKKGVDLAEKVSEFIYKTAFTQSCKLADEKGPFPLVKDSIWAKRKRKPRNVALITYPPSSGNAVICETTFGIEPYFALAYEQNVLDGMRLKNIVPAFTSKLKERGCYSKQLVQKIIDNHGSAQGIKEIPEDLRKVFRVAHDIHWKDHLKMQAAFQKWTDNAITKTINMPSTTTTNEVEEAYLLAWKLGCKGVTVYRDQARKDQVFEFGSKKNAMKCPNCEILLKKDNKCYKCTKCGFSTCEL